MHLSVVGSLLAVSEDDDNSSAEFGLCHSLCLPCRHWMTKVYEMVKGRQF